MLVDALRTKITKQDTSMGRAITPEKQVAITLWMLGHCGSYQKTSHRFGVSCSTVAAIFTEVTRTMEKILLSRVVHLGDHRKVMDGFLELGFPQVIGAVDCFHIPFVDPIRQAQDFINRKKRDTMLMQATCDHTGRFMDVEIGWSGRNHESRVMRNSVLYEAMAAGVVVSGNPTITLCGNQIGPLLIADSTFPIRRWLMPLYKGGTTPRQALFNKHLNCARIVVECAFERLKARWKCLTAPLEVAEENLPSVISACVILHNICETHGQVLLEQQAKTIYVLPTLGAPMECREKQNAEGVAVREALTEYFWSQTHQ